MELDAKAAPVIVILDKCPVSVLVSPWSVLTVYTIRSSTEKKPRTQQSVFITMRVEGFIRAISLPDLG